MLSNIVSDPLISCEPMPRPSHCIVTPDIIGPIKNGGIGTACFHLAKFLRKDLGQSVTILFTGPIMEGSDFIWRNYYRDTLDVDFFHLAAHVAQASIPTHNGHWFVQRSMAVDQVLRTKPYSHIHFQDMQANGFIPIQAKKTGLAYGDSVLTCTAHSSHHWIREGMKSFVCRPIEERLLTFCENYALVNADLTIFPSNHMREWLSEKGVKPLNGRHVSYWLFGVSSG